MQKTGLIIFNIAVLAVLAAAVVFSMRQDSENSPAGEGSAGGKDRNTAASTPKPPVSPAYEKTRANVEAYVTAFRTVSGMRGREAEKYAAKVKKLDKENLDAAKEDSEPFFQVIENEKDVKLAKYALTIIIRTPSGEILPRLITCYPRAGRALKTDLIGLIGSLEGEESLAFICKLIETEKDITLKRPAVQALSEKAPKSAIPVLKKIISGKGDLSSKRTAVGVLARFKSPDVDEFLGKLTLKAGEPGLRTKALNAYADKTGAKAVAVLVEVLGNETDASVKRSALKRLGEIGRKSKNDYIVNTLREFADFEADPDLVREAAAQVKMILQSNK